MQGPDEETDAAGQAAGCRRATGIARAPGTADPPTGGSPRGDRSKGEVVVVLPALNEEAAVGTVIRRIPAARLRSLGYDVAIWVVDGQSTDRTMEIARAEGAATFVQDGRGKGNGVRQALDRLLAEPPRSAAAGRDRLFVMLDADGTYPAEEIPQFVAALESREDMVLGSRLRGTIQEGAISGMNLLGNRLLSAFASLLFRARVSDVCTGMWAFREAALRDLDLVATGFDLEADLFASACERGIRPAELPIPYARRIGDAKLVPLRTGVLIAWRLLVRRLQAASREPRRALGGSALARGETA